MDWMFEAESKITPAGQYQNPEDYLHPELCWSRVEHLLGQGSQNQLAACML